MTEGGYKLGNLSPIEILGYMSFDLKVIGSCIQYT